MTPIHFQEMASGCQILVDSQRVSMSNDAGKREGRQTMGSRRFLAGFVEFALQVLLGDLHVAQGHPQGRVAEQLHQCREADPKPEHLGGKRMAKTNCSTHSTTRVSPSLARDSSALLNRRLRGHPRPQI